MEELIISEEIAHNEVVFQQYVVNYKIMRMNYNYNYT